MRVSWRGMTGRCRVVAICLLLLSSFAATAAQ
jgi:hypothetical protein